MAFKAADCFKQAIAIAPDFARAFAGLADSLIMLTEMGPMAPVEAMPKAKEAALKALSLDADLAEAHASLGMVLQDYEYDFDGAERAFLRAIELNPNSPIPRQSYGILLTELERHNEAEEQFAKMEEVDPLSVVGNWIHSFCLFLARRFDDALELAEKTLELDPSFGVAYLTVAFAYQMKGEYEKSAEAYAVCSEVMGSPANASYVRESFAGGWENFLRAMTSPERPITFSSYIVAVFFATLGDKDGAFTQLEAAFEKRESHIVMVKADPRFDSIRDDPRYTAVINKIGFPD
jgi:tetratricopeptide (TPR) repeat protein